MDAKLKSEDLKAGDPSSKRYSKLYVTLTPVLFLVYFSIFLAIPLSSQVYLQIICRRNNSADDDFQDCISSSSTSAKASMITLYTGLVANLPCLLLAGPYGSIADKFGRKLTLLISMIGVVMFVSMLFVVATWELSNFFSLLLFSNLMLGLSGSIGTFQMSVYTYIVDITALDRSGQTTLFSVFESLIFISKILGPIIGGVWARYQGFSQPLLAASIFSLLALVWAIVFIKESLPMDSPLRTKPLILNPMRTLENLYLVYTYRVTHSNHDEESSHVTSSNVDHGRSPLPYMLTAFTLFFTATLSNVTILVYYVTNVFSWKSDLIGYYLAVEGIIQTISMLGLPRVVDTIRRKKTHSIDWIMLGYLARGIHFAMFGLCTSTTEVFCLGSLLLFTGPIFPRNRVMFANLVPPAMQSRIQSALAAIDTLAAVMSPVFTFLYSMSVSHSTNKPVPIHANLVYFVFSALLLVAFIITVVMVSQPDVYKNIPGINSMSSSNGNEPKTKSVDLDDIGEVQPAASMTTEPGYIGYSMLSQNTGETDNQDNEDNESSEQHDSLTDSLLKHDH